MTHAIIGLFDDRTEAEAAMSELTERGFTIDNMDISRATSGGSTASTTSGGDNESFGDKVSDFFSSLFGADSEEARKYSSVASEADAILTVQTDSEEQARVAAEIMDSNGAVDVDDRSTQTGAGFSGNREVNSGQDLNIPIVEEQLQVGKREVESGGVRVRSRIIEKPVEEHIRLREEHVTVNRRPVDRAISGDELRTFQEGEFEITEHAEKAVVAKEARVVEEVSVNKEVNEREEVVRDTVRSTDVDVEELDRDARSRGANN